MYDEGTVTDRPPNTEDETFDPEMTEGDEANAPQGTRAETGELETEDRMAEADGGIPADPERPT
jgi:hypothetical protein